MKIEDITLDWLMARVIERDGCLIWAGHIGGKGKVPQVRIDYKLHSANRVVWEFANGREVPDGCRVGTTCGNDGCLHPDHLKARKVGTLLKGKPLALERKMRIAMAKRATAKLTADDVQAIRNDPRPAIELVQEFKAHHSAICRIRRGELWRDYSNPFAGLGA